MVIRVASVPACHPYPSAITDPSAVTLLPDPRPSGDPAPGQWWPPRWLEPGYLDGRTDEFDVLHLHFGFDTTPIEQLTAFCGILARDAKPLIVTVHDLHNPHFEDSAEHRARLEVLVREADSLITLTNGAARAVAAAWGRSPEVIAHPCLLPPAQIGAPRPHRISPVVAVHAKSLRANLDPWPVVEALAGAGCAVRLDLDAGASTSPRAPRDLAERLAHLHSRGVDVRVHPEFTDAELRTYLHEIDVLVLPYRFGTHSGWVELCYDAGVIPVVPACGFFHEQHDVPVFTFDQTHLDEPGLLAAVKDAVAQAQLLGGHSDPERRERRVEQLRDIRRAHTRIYRAALKAG